MGENASKPVIYLCLAIEQQEQLSSIRHWKNLELGQEENSIWVKNFTDGQLKSIEIKSMPAKQLYYEQDGQLFIYGNLLPERKVPLVSWSSISKALAVHLPILNHNYFGTKDNITLRLVRDQETKVAAALLCSLEILDQYIQQAASVRLKNLNWCILEDQALILGQPMLPIQGVAYWRLGNFLMPAGFNFNYPSLSKTLNRQINPQNQHWILFNKNNSYQFIQKTKVTPLSISSFRRSSP